MKMSTLKICLSIYFFLSFFYKKISSRLSPFPLAIIIDREISFLINPATALLHEPINEFIFLERKTTATGRRTAASYRYNLISGLTYMRTLHTHIEVGRLGQLRYVCIINH